MQDDEPPGNPLDLPDTDDEFERTPLPPPAARRYVRRYQRPQPPRRWRFWAIPAAAVIIVTLLLVITGSAVANTQPVQINAGPWLRVPLQAHDGRAVHSFAPSPADPNTVVVCVGPLIGSTYPAAIGPIWLFRSRDLGAHWQQLALPPLAGASCSISVAGDAPVRVTLSVEAWTPQSKQMPACADTTLFLSDDGGDTWRHVPHTSIGPAPNEFALCSFWATAHHLFFSYNVGVPATTRQTPGGWVERSLLERSDDGQTWQRADNGLPSGSLMTSQVRDPNASSDENASLTGLYRAYPPDAPPVGLELWKTQDAGRSWHNMSTVQLPLNSGTVKEPEQQPRYIVLRDQLPSFLFRTSMLQLSPDLQHWAFVPPLPVRGTAPDRAGIAQVLGVLADGRLFVLGVNPHQGLSPTSDPNGAGSSYQAPGRALDIQWVWIWNPRTVHWEVVMSPLNVAEHAHYGCATGRGLRARRTVSLCLIPLPDGRLWPSPTSA
jgi:hypothetical protein